MKAPRRGLRLAKFQLLLLLLVCFPAGVLEAAKGFRRVKGCKDMPTLVTALRTRHSAGSQRVVGDGCVVENRAATSR